MAPSIAAASFTQAHNAGMLVASRNRVGFQGAAIVSQDVTIEFGTSLMAQLLGTYKGRVFPALTAYNAGEGNAARWLQRFGDDPDLLVEQIPFAETQTYVRIVYDNSASNPRNPSSPPRRVQWGEQSTDEMGSIGFLLQPVTREDEAAWQPFAAAWLRTTLVGAVRNGVVERLRASRALQGVQ